MENNFNESMNLSGIANANFTENQDPVAPVFDGVTTTSFSENQTVVVDMSNEQLGQVQNMHTQIVGNADGVTISTSGDVLVDTHTPIVEATEEVTAPTTETEVKNTADIYRDDTIVPVGILKDLVSKARKVANYNAVYPQSQVITIELGDFGIKVNSAYGSKISVDYEGISDAVKYNTTLKVSVDIQKLGALLGSIEFPEVKLSYENNVFTIGIPETELTPIDLDNLINGINQTKPVRNLPVIVDELDGVLFSNLILASDRNIVYIQNNQDILKTQKFFITKEFCDLITAFDFDANNFRIGFVTDSNNDIRAIILSDGKSTLCGNVRPDAPQINEEACNSLWNAEFPNLVRIDTKRFVNALKRTKLFMSALDDKNTIKINVMGNTLTLLSDTGASKDNIIIENATNYTANLSLSMVKLELILNSIKSDTFTIAFDPSDEGVIGFIVDNYKWIISAD
jgi:hypothetical protein